MANYDITTVDWNPEQTKRWLSYVEKNCPNANITLVNDTKPIPWSWSAGKLNCFNKFYNTDRIIYMDTDTLVFEDMEKIFDVMDGNVGASLFHFHLCKNRRSGPHYARSKEIESRIGARPESFVHWNTGIVILNGYDPFFLYANWKLAFEFHEVKNYQFVQSEETAFSIAVLMDRNINMWEIPFEVHGNIVGGQTQFGNTEKPISIHYHKIERLAKKGLNGWLELKESQ